MLATLNSIKPIGKVLHLVAFTPVKTGTQTASLLQAYFRLGRPRLRLFRGKIKEEENINFDY